MSECETSIWGLYLTQELVDLSLIAKDTGNETRVHACVFAMASRKLHQQLVHEVTGVLKMDRMEVDVEEDVLRIMLPFVYNGVVRDAGLEMLLKMLPAAVVMGLNTTRIVASIQELISKDAAAFFVLRAAKLPELASLVSQHLRTHFTDIVRSSLVETLSREAFVDLLQGGGDHIESFRAIRRWCTAHSGEDVKDLLELVDLEKLPTEVLVSDVVPSGLVKDEKLVELFCVSVNSPPVVRTVERKIGAQCGSARVQFEAVVMDKEADGLRQKYTVNRDGLYRLSAVGAKGGDVFKYNGTTAASGGCGMTVSGVFQLMIGQVLLVVVGRRGADGPATHDGRPHGAGGGGGTFAALVLTDGALKWLVVAGGGGGAAYHMDDATFSGCDAVDTEEGAASCGFRGSRGAGAGGSGGGPGQVHPGDAEDNPGGPGAGVNPADFSPASPFCGHPGLPYGAGGSGGAGRPALCGGFGGGGGGSLGDSGSAGGGGGYSGGGAGSYAHGGGGGGSFCSSDRKESGKSAVAGTKSGNGSLTILGMNPN